jgi:hypothetical protein
MKPRSLIHAVAVILFAAVPTAVASTTLYVNGVSGSDSNSCKSPTTACKTIGHAISQAVSGDAIIVAPATYKENLTIGKSLNIIGSGASAPIIDGRSLGTVVTISSANAHVTLSKLTIRNGLSPSGAGIYNIGTLTIKNSTLNGNSAVAQCFFPPCFGTGGGVSNFASLTINNSTLSGNSARGRPAGFGGGIYNHFGTLTISNSTLSGNSASGGSGSGSRGGGIYNAGALTINNGTLSGNSAGSGGGGIYSNVGSAALQNSIVANSPSGGDCSGTITSTSHGYNLSSDNSCDFDGPGDLNNINPVLGTLGNYGGPTPTIPLLSGSPAIDGGNPSGCTNSNGVLLKTDQRGYPRPDPEDSGGCDMGAYERQSD